MKDSNKPRLRSEIWFNDPKEPGETAIYIERFSNYGITRQELQSARPIIGIAQSGSDVVPCNRIHMSIVERVKAGIRDAGGVPMEFPTHPLQESARRPTAALDRNLAYLGLVEILAGYPFDGVVLTTGCDKTTPSALMAAATVNMPAIVLSGGPMLDSYVNGKLAGTGMVLWEARRLLAAGEITNEQLVDRVVEGIPSAGHCNTMGTALSMNSLAEALGMSLPGCGTIPAPYAERAKMAYHTGQRIVEMVREDLTPSRILTREAFENAIVVNSAIGGSTNCPPHIIAIARHMGVELTVKDWETVGHHIHLLVNLQPAGEYLGEAYHRAGGVPAVVGELMQAGKIRENAITVTGQTMGENCKTSRSRDTRVICTYSNPLKENAGQIVVSGNLFHSALVKTSVISDEFRKRYLSEPGNEDTFVARAIVFDSPEDYRVRIEDPSLQVDESCILVVRNSGPIGYPGSAEVVNMTPPGYLLQRGVRMLPCMGDGRQSGTSDSPSILNISPEAAVGGNLAILQTGDKIRVALGERKVDVLLDDAEIARRRALIRPNYPKSHSPWEEFYREHTGQLETGACLEFATHYHDVRKVVPRHSH
ncbi:MAG TPA: IlvD/Edd family dehydratase [Candidatus Binatia bacterium]|nr:IlvD/Edd family dehydratase [Candidatus Binatia bacterium]